MRACALFACALAAGCSDSPAAPPDAAPDAAVAPVFRNPVTLGDDELAQQALQIIGKLPAPNSAPCKSCHTMTRAMLTSWQASTAASLANGCFSDLTIATTESALAMIDCMRKMPGSPDFSAKQVGVLSTGAELPWFDFLFWRAYGDQLEQDKFIGQAGMPKGDPTLAQPDFDLVAEWFVRGIPSMEKYVPPDP